MIGGVSSHAAGDWLTDMSVLVTSHVLNQYSSIVFPRGGDRRRVKCYFGGECPEFDVFINLVKSNLMIWTVKVIGLGAVAVSLSMELLMWLLRRHKPGKVINEVLFFPSETACVEHIFTDSSPKSCFCLLPHDVETSFSRLLRHIMSASSSLDLCVFAFSHMDLCRAVLALHHKGVTVRVLTDKDYSAITGSQIGVLRKAGVCVRCDKQSVYMHHKFALVDGQVLITGSLNWTLTAVQSNMENVIISMEPGLVQPFIQEFHRLWVHNDPARYNHSSDQKASQVINKTND